MPGRIVVVPHTHWDREWYLPQSLFRQRLVVLLDDVVDQLTRDRSLRFHLDGQAILADDYLDVRPEQRARVQRLVESGRLTIGPWYVLADELLAGDEPLVRNLLMGRKRSAALGGWLAVGYSPDAFGHPAALPTILRGFGIEWALVWRGHGGCGDRPDRDLFRWRAPDGSEVLTHHLPPAGYEYGAELPTRPDVIRSRWRDLAAVLTPRATTPVLLVMNGADHHALQPDLGQAVRGLRQAVRDARVEIGTLDTYFAAAREAVAATGARPPVVEGELRDACGHTWALQGVAATRTALKQRIAEGAALLTRWAEPQVALATDRDRRPQLARAWRTHLANLFHDVLAGSVADEVAEDAMGRARGVIEEARALLRDALDARLAQDPVVRRRLREGRRPALVLVNPSPRSRGGVVEATVTLDRQPVVVGRPADLGRPVPLGPFHLADSAGRTVPMQILGVEEAYDRLDSPRDYPESARVWAVRVALRAPSVPAFGLTRLDVRFGIAAPAQVSDRVGAAAGVLTAPWGRITAGARGFQIRRGGRTRPFEPMLTSERDEGDTYTIEPVPGERPLMARWGRPRVVWKGPLSAALARPFRIGRRVRGTMFVRLDAGSPLVRVTVDGVNAAGNHRVRLLLPVRAREATADMAYGGTTRPVVRPETPPYPREHPPTTAPMHRYVSAGGWTVFARGLHEYELLPDGSVAVTLLRAVGDLSRGNLRARPGHAGWPTATPGAQGMGPFRAEVALAPAAVTDASNAEAWDAVETWAETFHAPVAGYMCRAGIDLPAERPGPSLEGRGLAFKALKPREDGPGVVLRCVNLTRRARSGAWRMPAPVTRAFRVRLDETIETELRLPPDRRRVAFTASPREVVTILVEW